MTCKQYFFRFGTPRRQAKPEYSVDVNGKFERKCDKGDKKEVASVTLLNLEER